MFYLMTHSTHFISGYKAVDLVREKALSWFMSMGTLLTNRVEMGGDYQLVMGEMDIVHEWKQGRCSIIIDRVVFEGVLHN